VVPLGLELVDIDLCELPHNFDAFSDQDLVIHTAAILHADTPSERATQRRVNVDATRSVIEACRSNKIPRLIHVSTTAAIGIPENSQVPADEDFRFNLNHLDLSYNRTKLEAEAAVFEANRLDLETVIVNPGFIFGRHRGNYRGKEVVERVLHSRVVACTNGGLSIVHVEDVVDGLRRAASTARPGQRYILSGENLSFRDIARTVCRVVGERRLLLPVPNVVRDVGCLYASSRFSRGSSPDHPVCLYRRYAYPYYSSEKAKIELGYQPQPFAGIVEDVLDYLREQA